MHKVKMIVPSVETLNADVGTQVKRALGIETPPKAETVHALISVKEMTLGASIPLTAQGHKVNGTVDQALVGAIKPNLISDLIQRGALR